MVCPNIVFEINSAGLVSWASVWDPIVMLRGLGIGIGIGIGALGIGTLKCLALN